MRSLTIVLVYLTSNILFGVTIGITGNGSPDKFVIKSLPQTNSVLVNYDDDLDQVDFTSNENTAKQLTDPFDTTGDGSDGNPHVSTDDDGYNNTWNNTATNGENLDSVFDNPNRDPTTQSSLLDSDDDVPMLKEIKAVLQGYEETLSQKEIQEDIAQSLLSFRAELNATRGDIGEGNQTRKATLADIANRVTDVQGEIYIEGQGYKDTQLSDLYKELVKLNDSNVTENNFTEVTAETITTQKNQVEDATDSFNELAENVEISVPSEIAEADASVMLTWNFRKGDKSFDLLNISDASGINIPSLKASASYIKKFLGWVIAFLFIIAMKNAGLKVLEDIPKFTTSAPVTNWSILGNSAGALVAKSTYLVILIAFIGIIGTNLAVINNEAQLLGNMGAGFNSLSTALAGLSAGQGFMSDAFTYMALFIPIASILTTIGSYYSFKFTTWILINIQIMSMRAVT